mgnify:CR=1 FL=1
MSGWDKFVETFFNAKVMWKYLPDILSGMVVTIELALLIVVSGLGAGLALAGQESELHSAIGNPVLNAARYTPEGGEIRIEAQVNTDGHALIAVQDSGIGISEASLPRVFDEFYQVQSNRPLEAHQRKGLGLGLAATALRQAGVKNPEAVRVHDLRHTFAVQFYDKKKDIRALQERLHHKSLATTDIYVREFLEEPTDNYSEQLYQGLLGL